MAVTLEAADKLAAAGQLPAGPASQQVAGHAHQPEGAQLE